MIKIEVKNYRGVENATIAVPQGQVRFIEGKNGEGKSSQLEAIASTACHVINPINIKAQARTQYGHSGAGNPSATVFYNETDSLKINFGNNMETSGNAGLRPCHLQTQWINRFSILPKKDRKIALSEIVKTPVTLADFDGFDVSEKIIKEWLESDSPDWETINKTLQAQRLQQKRNFHDLTGVTYSKKAAENYTPAGFSHEMEAMADDELQDRIAEAKAKYDALIAVKSIDKQKLLDAETLVKAHDIRDVEANITKLTTLIENSQSKLVELRGEYRQSPDMIATQSCPCCNAELIIEQGNILQAPTEKPSAESIAKITADNAKLKKQADAVKKTIENNQISLDDAKLLKRKITDAVALIAEAKAVDANHDANLAIAEQRYNDLTGQFKLVADYRKARAIHEAVIDYDVLVDATDLSKGAPAIAGAKAQSKFVTMCQHISKGELGAPEFDWQSGDILWGGRLIEMCSKSERWRADALITLAIAVMTGAWVVTLDDAECCDGENMVFLRNACDRAILAKPELSIMVGVVK